MYLQLVAIGRLGDSPDMKYGKSGAAYTRFSVAVNRRWTGKDGEKGEQTTWLRCTAFNALAESIAKHADKGSLVFVQGRLDPAEDGNPRLWGNPPRASFDVVVQTCRFLGGNGGTGEDSAPVDVPQDSGAPSSTEDIPF